MRRRPPHQVAAARAPTLILAVLAASLPALHCSSDPTASGSGGEGAGAPPSGVTSVTTSSSVESATTTTTSSGSAGNVGGASTSGSGGDGGSGGLASGGGGSAGGGASGGAGGQGGGTPPTVRVRLVAANTSSGNFQSYTPGEGIRIFQGLKPDIAMIQELNYGDNSAAAISEFVTVAFGSGFSHYREPAVGIPNGIVSRYPIIESGQWDDPKTSDREFAWAKIDVPGPAPLWAVSVHLRTKTVADREDEAKALVAHLSKVVAKGDLVVVGGDLNSGSRTEAAVEVLRQIVIAAAPYPADQGGNEATNAPRSQALDWLIANEPLHAVATPVAIGAQLFPAGLVFDSRVYAPLTDVAPVQQGDSGAPGMQHMAVVRDFMLPDAP